MEDISSWKYRNLFRSCSPSLVVFFSGVLGAGCKSLVAEGAGGVPGGPARPGGGPDPPMPNMAPGRAGPLVPEVPAAGVDSPVIERPPRGGGEVVPGSSCIVEFGEALSRRLMTYGESASLSFSSGSMSAQNLSRFVSAVFLAALHSANLTPLNLLLGAG